MTNHQATFGVHRPIPLENRAREDFEVVAEPSRPFVAPIGLPFLLQLQGR